MRKRRTREHVIADLSVNHVERLVLRCGWTIERTRYDYGIDLDMHTFTPDGEVENGKVLFQLKATDTLKKLAAASVIAVRLEWRDLLFWVNEAEPVILILYDARKDKAYWLYVQEYFRQTRWAARTAKASTTVTVHIPADQVLDEAAIRLFARFRDELRTASEEESPMIARSNVTFAELRQLLVDLGFTVGKRGKFWFFEHPPSETWFAFRPYKVRERVTLRDVNTTRFFLDWRGVLAPEAFDDRLKKATA